MSFSFVFVEISLYILDLIFFSPAFFWEGGWAFYPENHSHIRVIQIQLSHYEIEHPQGKQFYKLLKALSV